eukprot:TRINITY_DN660_c0_g1_i3.p1 TRINITY_DN660_c0_g1~~TRINITY_DN660_c0_g1_i3.p1  ORF type:complete len:297 (+),score=41.14 TRINITY_DN660_c0_g1_i3:463-1353(+)
MGGGGGERGGIRAEVRGRVVGERRGYLYKSQDGSWERYISSPWWRKIGSLSGVLSEPSVKGYPWLEQVSWSPRVFIFHNLLSDAEADHIVAIANNSVTASEVVGATGKSVQDNARTSSGVFMEFTHMLESPVLRDLERRIAEFTHLPVENGESFYVLRYQEGQQYVPHMDWFDESPAGQVHIGDSGNRFATVLTYLAEPEQGGETHFPKINLKVPVVKGDAVLFYDMLPDGTGDEMSLHGGSSVEKGVKWAITKWIRQKKSHSYWRQYADEVQREKAVRQDREYFGTDIAFGKDRQ